MELYEYLVHETYDGYDDIKGMQRYLNKLGEKGWKLVETDTVNTTYVFMRPKTPDIIKGE